MRRVALISLSGLRIREPQMRELGMRLPTLQSRAAALARMPSLGLLTLAGQTPDTWECSYHEIEDASDESVESVLDVRPDLIAVSTLSASVDQAYRFVSRVRRHGIPLVIGGLHATACPEEAARHFDVVAVGDGEAVWPAILRDAQRGALMPRYCANGTFDLADSPVPRYDLLGAGRRDRLTLQTQRGCPFACEFCAASRLLGRFREKPLANIERELAALNAQMGSPIVELADDNTFAGRRDAVPLLELFAGSGIRYFTEVDWRIGERPEIVARLADSGCVQVLIGFESLTFRYPGMGAKQAAFERMINAAEAIQASGVAVIGCFIVGGDGETHQSIDRLAEFILASPLADVQLTVQTPFPGSPLHRRLKSEGRLRPEAGWECCTLFDVMYEPDRMSAAELSSTFRAVVGAVFSPAANEHRQRIRRAIWRNRFRGTSCPSPLSFAS